MFPLFNVLLAGLALLGSSAAGGAEPLRFRLTADPATLDWNLARSSHENPVIMNLMEGLVEEGKDLSVEPALAERWEVSPDGRTYVFHLREGVKWSDGRPLKAQDFVDSWLRLLDPRTQASYWSYLSELEGAEAFHAGKARASAVGVKALGDRRLQVTLRRSVPHFLHLLTFWVSFPIRLDLVKKHGPRWTQPGKIATLGPYLLLDWQRGRSIQLTRNPSYFGKAPQVAEISAVIEPDDAKARALFEAGKIDFLLDATTQDLLRPRKKSRVQQFPYLATYYLGFNVTRGALKSAGVRKALALAIDREGIPARLQGGQVAAKGFIPPGLDGHGAAAALSGDIYEARALLAKEGYAEGRRFPRLVISVEKFDRAEQLAEYVRASLKDKLGIDAQAQVVPPERFQKLLREKRADAFIAHWGADFPDAQNFLAVFESKSGTNATGWRNERYDEAVRAAVSTQDKVARLRLYAMAEEILLKQDVVVLPLFYRKNTVLLGERVRGFEISPLNYLFFKKVEIKD